ncbi:hypothetical protein [Streptomyces sp. NPDC059009]|uniref:hypothetical protein n=1 Tax=Streptomyces sp. NPDC059009 TaxID=3346694 RepID=UPI0036A674C5
MRSTTAVLTLAQRGATRPRGRRTRSSTTPAFSNRAHINRWFKRTYGITPATYQRAAR